MPWTRNRWNFLAGPSFWSYVHLFQARSHNYFWTAAVDQAAPGAEPLSQLNNFYLRLF